MNLAIGAIVLFVLFIVPPLIFRRLYYTGEFSKEYFKSTPFQVFLASIVPGVIFQALQYLVAVSWFGHQPDLSVLTTLAIGGDTKEVTNAINTLKQNLGTIILYNLLLWLWVGGLALGFKFLVRKSHFVFNC